MGFFDSLQNSPNNSSIYGSGGNSSPDLEALFSYRKRIKQDDLERDEKRANFMSDLSVRQNRMKSLYDPSVMNNQNNQQPQMNTVFKEDPNKITPFQSANLGLKQQDINVDKSRIAQSGKLGEERFGLEQKKHELDVKKNQNIYETKQADMQRKMEEAQRKADLAERTLQGKQGDTAATLEFHKAQLEATNARHALEMSQKERQLEEAQKVHDATIENQKNRTKQAGKTTKTTELGGQKKTETTTKGSQRVGVTHPDGTHGTIDSADAENLPEGWKLD